jgi:hypothetical protein
MGVAERLNRRLSLLSRSRFQVLVYSTTVALYLLGVWLHAPYHGGHIYSDITYVFQSRQCLGYPPQAGQYVVVEKDCALTVPYLKSFIEYPVIAAMFLFGNAVIGGMVAGNLLTNYYLFSALFLSIPTLLAVRELMRLIEMRGVSRNRILWYFLVTPTFIYMTLLNWYMIGVCFTLIGVTRYLQGRTLSSGVLFGLSAASNFVTAVPAFGLFIASTGVKERARLAGSALLTYAAINAPFIILNSKMWQASFAYIYSWNIEDSWMQAILPSLYSPQRHAIPEVVFAGVIAIMLWLRYRNRVGDPLVFAFISMFGYTFATYIYTPQLNLALLPFFVLLPVSGYLEFLAFDITNALIILVGFSQALLPLGIRYRNLVPVTRGSVVWWIEVIRSVWEGRFTFFNGAWSYTARQRGRGGGDGQPSLLPPPDHGGLRPPRQPSAAAPREEPIPGGP